MRKLIFAGLFVGVAWTAFDVAPASIRNTLSCYAPSGAMHSIAYDKRFIGKLHDLSFSCVPLLNTACGSYFCTKFTAIDEQDKHVIGYVWRDVRNEPQTQTCSPDGGKAGSFYGECPVGTPVPTVYKCPWCEPDFSAKADLRGVRGY